MLGTNILFSQDCNCYDVLSNLAEFTEENYS